VTASCEFVVQLVSTVDKILTDSASRGPSAVAEFLVYVACGRGSLNRSSSDVSAIRCVLPVLLSVL